MNSPDRPPGERRTATRRKDDREGRTRTATELRAMSRLDRGIGFILIITGGLVIGGVFKSLVQGGASASVLVVVALVAMGYGVYLISRRERRRGGRRQVRTKTRGGEP